MRLSNWIRKEAERMPWRKPDGASSLAQDAFRLTPGQFAELCAELGLNPSETSSAVLETCWGSTPIRRVECRSHAKGENVFLCGRDDLFFSADEDAGIQTYHANEVTSIPENVGCCEVISVGERVDNVKPGDVVFIDFFDVKVGAIISNDEVYCAPAEAFKARWNTATQSAEPLDNYVITKRSLERCKVAIMGSDRFEAPAYRLTEGIISGRTSSGDAATHVIYEEVIAVGKLTARERPGLMTKAERAMLEDVAGERGVLDPGLWIALKNERKNGRASDVALGELVAFCKEVACPVRVRGDFLSIVPYNSILCGIDDAAILASAREQQKKKLAKRKRILLKAV